MCNPRTRTLAVIFAVALVSASSTGCASSTDNASSARARMPAPDVAPPPVLPARDAAVLEAAFRELLREEAEPGTIAYVGLGRPQWPADPPPDLLARLADLPLRLAPVSKARLPGFLETVAPDVFRSVEDPTTGRPAWAYFASVSWRSETEASVCMGSYGGSLAGTVGYYTFTLRAGRWVSEFRGSPRHW